MSLDGMSVTELSDKVGQLGKNLADAVGIMRETQTDKESDKARWTEADAARIGFAEQLQAVENQLEVAKRRETTEKAVADMEQFLSTQRTPSKAFLGGGGRSTTEYTDGDYITAIFRARNQDYGEQQVGKAALATMGAQTYAPQYNGVLDADPSSGKATTGTTGAGGLYIAPNALVTRLVTIATALNPMRNLLNVIDNVATPSVAVPVEATAATRAVVAAWGTLKDNTDLTFLQYTATFYTLAKIHDVSNQLLRYSAGAAEQDVTQRLGRSIALGEAYYIISGSGTNEPTGINTALAASGLYDTADAGGYATPAASVYGTIAIAIGALESRNRSVDGAIMNPADFWTYLALEGSAIRPYFNSYTAGEPLPNSPNASQVGYPNSAPPVNPLFGVPIVRNSNCPAGTAIIGEFKSATLYTGLGYRIDTSSEAGTRWDYNLTGYRAEEEIAFNATPYVIAGMFQRLTGVGT